MTEKNLEARSKETGVTQPCNSSRLVEIEIYKCDEEKPCENQFEYKGQKYCRLTKPLNYIEIWVKKNLD